jgi:acyl dehydratase
LTGAEALRHTRCTDPFEKAEESMPPSKDLIGRELSTGSATIDAEHVAAFARALRDPNPAYQGPDASTAPLTYPIAFMTQAMAGGMNTFLELGLNFMTLVHGEQEFEYLRPLRVGETLTLTGRIGDIYEKTGSSGTLDFVVLETEGKDAEGEPVFYSRNTIISKRT